MNVIFKHGTYAQYKAISNPDEGTLYFITDRGLIYKGSVLVTNKIIVEAIEQSGNTPAHLKITDNSTTNPTEFEVYSRSQVDALLATVITSNDAMVFKGTIGVAGQEPAPTVNALPATHEIGWTYRVVTAGTYAGVACEIGDLIICVEDGTTANNAHWTVCQNNIDGAVTAAATLVSGCLVLGGGGKTVQTLANGNNGDLLTIKDGVIQWFAPSFAASSHTHSAADITSGIFPVARGGTGHSSLTAGRVLVGSGTSPVTLLEIDTQPVSGSDHLITSGAVASIVASAVLNWEELPTITP